MNTIIDVAERIKNLALHIEKEVSVIIDNTKEPVSYTHLDVYKRQGSYGNDGYILDDILDGIEIKNLILKTHLKIC